MDDHDPIAGYPTKRAMLEALYVEEGLSIKQVSNRIGTSTATIIRWMELLDIPRRARGGANTMAVVGWRLHRIDPRVAGCLPIKELAQLVHASESYVFKYVKGVKAVWNSQSSVQQVG